MGDREKLQIYSDIMHILLCKCGKMNQIYIEDLIQYHLSVRPEEEIRVCVSEITESDYPVNWQTQNQEILYLTDVDEAKEEYRAIRDEIFEY